MLWFKPKYSVCSVCHVHFEPVPDHLRKWGHLCDQHRREPMEVERRKQVVIAWATENWARLEDQALKEMAETKEKNNFVNTF